MLRGRCWRVGRLNGGVCSVVMVEQMVVRYGDAQAIDRGWTFRYVKDLDPNLAEGSPN
jgi:hypothetical protein